MYNIKNKKDLDTAILLLENEVEEQKGLLTSQFRIMYESFNPADIISNMFKGIETPGGMKNNILNAMLGISAGYFLKRMFFKKSKNPLKILLGNLLQYGVAILLLNHKGILKTITDRFHEFFDTNQADYKTVTKEYINPAG